MFLKYCAHFCVFYLKVSNLKSLEYLKYNSIFYFIIELRSAYIERYLCGQAEFKAHINAITVDFGSLLSHSSTTTSTLATPSSPSTTQNNPTRCPSPLMRDVGPISRHRLTSEARSHRSCPSPFQRDVGGLSSFNGGSEEGATPGGTQAVGGPRCTS